MNVKFHQNINLFAAVIIPALKNNQELQQKFIHNLEKIVQGLESDSTNKIKLLVKVMDKLSLIYNLKSFKKLSYTQRQNYISRLFNFPIGMVVAGLSGLKSIVFIAYYGIEDVWTTIDYQGPINK